MDIIQLKQDIMHNTLKNFYIFTGVESQVQRVYIQKISEVNGKHIKYVDSVLDIYGKSSGLLSVQTNYTYVCIEDRDIITNEHSWETINNAIGNNTLILWFTNIDRRGKFYKRFEDIICDFEHLSPEVLKKHIKDDIHLSNTNCDRLMQICEYDYSRCLLEIDKILKYDKHTGDVDKSFEYLVDNDVIYQPVGDMIFNFSNAVIDRRYKYSFEALHKYELTEEPPLKALSVLYVTFKKALQVQSCEHTDIKRISESTGISEKEVSQVSKHLGKYKIGELVYALKFIRNTEMKYKQGLIDDATMLPYVLVNIL